MGMSSEAAIGLTILIGLAACLYASVGHGGASGYLAAMALFGLSPDVMKPAALSLNILVAGIGVTRFGRARLVPWRMAGLFLIASAPAAFLGGAIRLPAHLYGPLVGAALLFAAYRLARRRATPPDEHPGTHSPHPALAMGIGGLIGLLSGLTGVGGGIFLSPIVLLLGWCDVRRASGLAAVFILINSATGLLGHLTRSPDLPPWLPLWAVAAVLGGLVGSHLGVRRLMGTTLLRLLAVVLVIAGLKMVLAPFG